VAEFENKKKGGCGKPGVRRSHLLLYFAITLIIMCNTIKHMFEGVRPFDWLMLVVEVAVLLLIAWEIGREEHFRCKERKRQLLLKQSMAKANGFISQGQTLQHTAPHVLEHNPDVVKKWMSSVESWIMDTNEFLSGCSSQASAKFLDDSHLPDVRFPELAVQAVIHARTLNRRLSNLQIIIQSPDIYFNP
jgi:hypothetical protein